ncbi:MAG: NADH-quinone oxidoreductase subunit NuoE [Dehalobacterium sp.]
MNHEGTTCACSKETEQEKLARIQEIIQEYRGVEGSLIQVLHLAQGIYGYLPDHVQQLVAREMNIPLTEVYGVVTFYALFNTRPKGENTIRVCMGTACYVRGAKDVLKALSKELGIKVGGTSEDSKFTLEVCRCIGACGLAPAITVNDKVYQKVLPEKVGEILAEY